jgi:alpha-1,2-mannosyltransferase
MALWRWLSARELTLRPAVYAVGALVVLSQWARVILRPEGDFGLHWRFGARFWAGEFLYAGNMHAPYPPFWAVACTPLALRSMPEMRTLLYPLGLVPLAALLWILHRLTRRHLPLAEPRRFWAATLALALSSRFLIRELPENGPNLMLVALAWGAVFLWVRGRDRLGGVCLGLAIALKCTPALFLAYFAWRRQWRLVAGAALAAALFTLSPALRQGPSGYARHMEYWTSRCWRGLTQPDPLYGVLKQEEVKNLSLRPGLARFLIHLPPDHKGYCGHPWHVDFLDLPPAAAGVVVKVVMFLLLGGVAWVLRHPAPRRDDPRVLWECAAVSVLMLLYSPVTWRQHCVGVIPAFYLISLTAAMRGGLPRWMVRALAAYVVLVLVLDRGVVGRELTLLLDSYSVTTWSLLMLLAVTLGGRALAAHEEPAPRDSALLKGPHWSLAGPERAAVGRVVDDAREGVSD